jgi:hypothetical protein
LKVNESDWSLVKEDEIELGVDDCLNVAFNGNGRISVVVGFNKQFVVLDIGKN